MKLLYALVAAACASLVSAHGVVKGALDNRACSRRSFIPHCSVLGQRPGVPGSWPARRGRPSDAGVAYPPRGQCVATGARCARFCADSFAPVLGPVADVTSTEMACGTGNPGPVNGIAQVDAGSDVSFQMSPWVHRSTSAQPLWPARALTGWCAVGPLTTYLGKCPGTPDKCDPNSLKWFKVDAKALKDDGKTWYHSDIGACARSPERLCAADGRRACSGRQAGRCDDPCRARGGLLPPALRDPRAAQGRGGRRRRVVRAPCPAPWPLA